MYNNDTIHSRHIQLGYLCSRCREMTTAHYLPCLSWCTTTPGFHWQQNHHGQSASHVLGLCITFVKCIASTKLYYQYGSALRGLLIVSRVVAYRQGRTRTAECRVTYRQNPHRKDATVIHLSRALHFKSIVSIHS